MPNLAERIRGLSQQDLDIWKRQLPQRLQELSELDRNTALEQLQGMPELADLFGGSAAPQPQQQPQDLQWWQYGIGAVTKPFQLAHEYVIEPFAAAVTSPFTPSVDGDRGLSWLEREKQEYRQWEEPEFTMPWGGKFRPTKGIIETLPWLAVPTAGGVAAKLGVVASRGGTVGRAAAVGARAIKPAVVAERMITYPIAKPMEIVGQKLAGRLAETARFIAPANEVIEKEITKDDWMRRVAQWFGRKPVFKGITEATGGKAATVGTTEAVEDVTARALLIHSRVLDRLSSKRAVAMSNLRQIHTDPVRLFGIDEATGLAKAVKGRASGLSKHINDIAEHPTKYILNDQQKAYIETVHNIEDWVLAGLKESGVDVKLLKFDEFSHWVHRVVLGKKVDGKLVELKKGFGRIGSKQSFQKTRFYESAVDGLEQGVIYSPNLEQSVDLYIQSAAKSIADKRIANMVAEFGEKPLERAWKMFPTEMQAAKEATYTLAGANQMIKVINRAVRGEKLTEATMAAQERRFPELGKLLRQAIGNKEQLQGILKEAKQIQEAARAPYWKARAERVARMEIARTPSVGLEASIMHPAFQGKIYPIGVAGEIQKYWDDLGFKPLNKLSTISSEMRTLVAAADFSAPFIQGLPAMGRYPKGWAQNVNLMFKSFGRTQKYQDFLTKHLDDLMEMSHYGGYVGGFEFMEAMPALQKTAGMVTRLATGQKRLGETAVRQSYGRFEAAFGSFGDGMRLYMWNALKARAKSPDELQEIARHVNRMTGVMSSKGLGIGATQRQFESAFLFFAPRYTRAGFALVGDMLKGGITGAEARKALGSMMAAGAVAYTGTCLALGQEPNFDPTTGRFMTIEIKDPFTGTTRHFGIGGMMTSLARFGADVTASMVGAGMNEPLDFVKLDRMDNPFLRFLYSKTAPLTGFLTGMVEGKNFFGEPFENMGDYAKFMGEQVMPIALQEMLMEEGGLAPSSIIAEELGARTFPRSDWEKRDIVRDTVAQQNYNMSWEDVGRQMGELYQRQLERDSVELQEATALAQETSSKMARGEGKIWDTWRKEGQAIEERYQQAVTLASQEFNQTGDGTTFRQKVDEASAVRRAMYGHREQNPSYAEIQDYFNEPLDQATLSKINPSDLARREYYNMMYSPDMYDQFGNYRFDEADRREVMFVQQFGRQALDYVEEYSGAKWQETNALRSLKDAKRILQPYWDIERQVWQNYPPELYQISRQIEILERTDRTQAKRILFSHPYGQYILMARREIALQRKWLKARNRDVTNALNMFYRY